MAIYPKKLRPPRNEHYNVVSAIRYHVNMAGPDNANGIRGPGTTSAAVHIGTIPAGSFLLPASKHLVTAFGGATPTIDIGTEAAPTNVLTSAQVMAAGVTTGLIGTITGYVAVDTPLFATYGGTPNNVGEVDIVIPFYAAKD